MWSMGCIFIELMNSEPLFAGRENMHQMCLLTENMKSELQKSVAHQSFPPRTNSAISDGVKYDAPEDRDLHGHMQSQMPDSDNSSSFSCVRIPHPRIQADNSVQKSDGVSLANKPFHLRPPHPAPSNQFSYIQADQIMSSHSEIPLPSCLDKVHFVQNIDSGNFYSDHNKMKLAPHGIGSCYPERGRMSYVQHPYGGLPYELAIANHSWVFLARLLAIVASRDPSFWIPR